MIVIYSYMYIAPVLVQKNPLGPFFSESMIVSPAAHFLQYVFL